MCLLELHKLGIMINQLKIVLGKRTFQLKNSGPDHLLEPDNFGNVAHGSMSDVLGFLALVLTGSQLEVVHLVRHEEFLLDPRGSKNNALCVGSLSLHRARGLQVGLLFRHPKMLLEGRMVARELGDGWNTRGLASTNKLDGHRGII